MAPVIAVRRDLFYLLVSAGREVRRRKAGGKAVSKGVAIVAEDRQGSPKTAEAIVKAL